MFSFFKPKQTHDEPGQVGVERQPPVVKQQPEVALDALEELEADEWKKTLYDIIKDIRDPEKPQTLEDLGVVKEELVEVQKAEVYSNKFICQVGFVPTVPHCSLATLIGLCLKTKLNQYLPVGQFKVELFIQPGSHITAEEITKQINDKERVAAAMENPNLSETVYNCIKSQE